MQEENPNVQVPPEQRSEPSGTESAPSREGGAPKAGNRDASGLTPNLAAALSYFLGPITGVVFLLLEKENRFVRFHAMQSTLTFGGLFVVNIILGFIPLLGWAISMLLSLVSVIIWLVLMIKAYQGEEFELPVIGQVARSQVNK